jgi:hypothetical protein
MGSDEHRRSRVLVIAMIVFAVGLSAVLAYFMHARSVELARELDSSDPAVVSDSLITMNQRHDPEGMEKAIALLKSDHAEVWINAAIYLGGMEKAESIPYLIKAMGDVEDDRKDEIVSDLTAITGQSFGGDANAWREWWLVQHPTGSFLLDSTLPSASMPWAPPSTAASSMPTALPVHPDSATRGGP